MHGLEKKGTVVEVPNGYAMNQLIPTKSAQPATPQNLKAEQVIADAAAKLEANESAFSDATAKIDAVTALKINAAANEQGHLFKAVSSDDLASVLKQHDIDTDLFLISFKEPVKEVGIIRLFSVMPEIRTQSHLQ